MKNRIDRWLVVLALVCLAALFVGDARAAETFDVDWGDDGAGWPTWYLRFGGSTTEWNDFNPKVGFTANWTRHGMSFDFGYDRIELKGTSREYVSPHSWSCHHCNVALAPLSGAKHETGYSVSGFYVLRLN